MNDGNTPREGVDTPAPTRDLIERFADVTTQELLGLIAHRVDVAVLVTKIKGVSGDLSEPTEKRPRYGRANQIVTVVRGTYDDITSLISHARKVYKDGVRIDHESDQ